MVVDLRTKLNLPVIHDPSPDDWIDLLAAHRLLERMTEIMPSSDLDPDCFRCGMQVATTGIAGIDGGSLARAEHPFVAGADGTQTTDKLRMFGGIQRQGLLHL